MRNCDFRAAAAERADDHAGDEARVEAEDDVATAATHEPRVDLVAVVDARRSHTRGASRRCSVQIVREKIRNNQKRKGYANIRPIKLRCAVKSLPTLQKNKLTKKYQKVGELL